MTTGDCALPGSASLERVWSSALKLAGGRRGGETTLGQMTRVRTGAKRDEREHHEPMIIAGNSVRSKQREVVQNQLVFKSRMDGGNGGGEGENDDRGEGGIGSATGQGERVEG